MNKIAKSTPCLLLLGLLFFSACGGTGDHAENTESQAAANAYKVFTYSSGDVSQRLQVRWHNDTAVSFVLEHHKGDCNYTLSGDAVNPYFSYDPEQDTDPENNDKYWVDQYLYNRESCRLAIRIAQDTSRVRLQVNNCTVSSTCGLEKAGILRRER